MLSLPASHYVTLLKRKVVRLDYVLYSTQYMPSNLLCTNTIKKSLISSNSVAKSIKFKFIKNLIHTHSKDKRKQSDYQFDKPVIIIKKSHYQINFVGF